MEQGKFVFDQKRAKSRAITLKHLFNGLENVVKTYSGVSALIYDLLSNYMQSIRVKSTISIA